MHILICVYVKIHTNPIFNFKYFFAHDFHIILTLVFFIFFSMKFSQSSQNLSFTVNFSPFPLVKAMYASVNKKTDNIINIVAEKSFTKREVYKIGK